MKALLFSVALAGSAFAQQALTLPEAEAIAVKNNPDVSAALLNAAAANQVTIEAQSAAEPVAFGSVTGTGALHGSNISAGALNNPAVNDRLASGVTVSQLITDFGRTRNLTASSRYRAQAQAERAKATRADIILQVDQAYFAGLRALEVLTVARQTVDARQLVADQVTALANSKLKSGLDVSFANVNLSQARLLLINAENAVKSAYADLTSALGYRDQRAFNLSDPGAPGPPPEDPTPLIQTSLQARPEIASARADYEGAQRFAIAEKELRNPTVSAVGTAGVVPAHEDVLHARYAAAGVNVNIPIFNGHLFSARQNEAELRAQAYGQNLRALENRITRDVQVAFLNTVSTWQRVAVTNELLAQANLALDLAQARYGLGLSSIVELSQAQLNQTSAQIDAATAKYEYDLERAVLDYQVGVAR